MPERKQIGQISVVTDDDTGMYHIGEIDGGFDPTLVKAHIESHGSTDLLQTLAYMTTMVVEHQREVNAMKSEDSGQVECVATIF